MARLVDIKRFVMVCVLASAGACRWQVQTRGSDPVPGGGTAGAGGTAGPVGYDRYNIPIEVAGPIEVVEIGRKGGEPVPERCAWRPWVVIKDHSGGGKYGAMRYPRNDEINSLLLYAVAEKVGYGDDVACDQARKLRGAPALMKAAKRAIGELGSILAVQWIDGYDWEVLRDDNTGTPIQQVRAIKVTSADATREVPAAPAAPTADNLEIEVAKKIAAMTPGVGDLEYQFGAAAIDPHLDLEWTDHYEKALFHASATFTLYERLRHPHGQPWQELQCGPISVLLVSNPDTGLWEGAPFGGRPQCGDHDCSIEEVCAASTP